jgi:uncharacterized membrane protein
MITRREIAVSLHAAWRLLLRDAGAIERFDNSVSGVIKSFYCALIVLPGYALILGVSATLRETEATPILFAVVNFIAYIAGWTAWPLVMHYVAPLINRDDAYCRYIAAYNWSSGPYFLIVLLLHIPVAFGLTSPQFLFAISVLGLVIMLFYHFFIVRIALRLRPPGAIGLVIAEYFLGDLILSLRHAALT